MTNITTLLKIKYPIIQAGMVWVSGGKLAAAAANSGCMGLIGAGSMKPDLLSEQIKKAQSLLQNDLGNLGVNIPLLYDRVEEQVEVALKAGIKVFFTSAGSPKKLTAHLKSSGCIVVHVVSNPLLAKKCEDAGVDAVVAEGFEAGGHNGREELTTMTLIPQVVDKIKIPVIAAGGIGDARTMAAALCLGAQAVQMGTRFMMTKESSAHESYKKLLVESDFTATKLSLKKHVPVRLVKNKFFREIEKLENECVDVDVLVSHLGKGRARKGMHQGDLEEGELESGQICGMINDCPTVEEMIKRLIHEYNEITKHGLKVLCID